ncbi:hypothetical protein H4R22_005358, partial [Coemansia sp. RSA 1290]
SGAGIAEGGRTGITTIVTGIMFFIALFFAPIFASFPPWATGPALIIVGSMMMQNVTQINWRYIGDALPAFVTIIMIPFGYSIGYGLIAGIGSFVAINSFAFIVFKLSRGRIKPPNFDDRDDWVGFITQGGIKDNIPGWMKWVAGKRHKSLDTNNLNSSTASELADTELKQITVDSHKE